MILEKSVMACEGEVSVKSYFCSQFDSRLYGIKAEGYLEITNKRLLFQALGKNFNGISVMHSEVAIGDVSDIKIFKGNTFSIIKFIVGLVISFAIASIVWSLLGMLLGEEFGAMLALGAFGYCAFRSWRWAQSDTFSLIVGSKSAGNNVVRIAGQSPYAANSSAASKALVARPGRDSEIMHKELGALILDIQNLGDHGIEKWKAGKS